MATTSLEQSMTLPSPAGVPPASTRNASAGQIPQLTPPSSSTGSFEIVSTYRALLSSDPELTMPVAAIESLVQLLAATPSLSTISETLDLLEVNITALKRAIPNAVSLSAGTDLFMRYLITALRPGSTTNIGAKGDFKSIRQHLLTNAKVFASRAKDARRAIAEAACRFVREGSVVLTSGGSRAVLAVLQAAANTQTYRGGAPRFKVIYVTNDTDSSESSTAVASLRALSVPVAVIPESAIAYCMDKVSIAIIGAEGVVENGGIISRLGTYQLAILAKAAAKQVYVVAESHKFVRTFPLGQFDLGVEQDILHFTAETTTPKGTQGGAEHTPKPSETYFDRWPARYSGATSREDAVDYTPPEYITALITETGVLTPSAVSEELIKIWD